MSSQVVRPSPPLEIIDLIDGANLREVCWNQKFLERVRVREEYKLQHRQAVAYCNVAHDRYRLVACFYGLAVLILPPVDQQDRASLYLKISQFLEQFGTRAKALKLIEHQREITAKRIERRSKPAKV